jgi:hypothetical protein
LSAGVGDVAGEALQRADALLFRFLLESYLTAHVPFSSPQFSFPVPVMGPGHWTKQATVAITPINGSRPFQFSPSLSVLPPDLLFTPSQRFDGCTIQKIYNAIPAKFTPVFYLLRAR